MAGLIDFCNTDKQRLIIEKLDKMSYAEIAKEVGSSAPTIRGLVARIKKRAALQGHSPEHDMTHTVPSTHFVKGTSTLYDEDGNVKAQWVKSSADMDRLKEFAQEYAKHVCQDFTPLPKRLAPTKKGMVDDELVVYPIGDAHIGLYCWHEDAEEDWDIEIADKIFAEGFDRLMEASPKTSEAVICNLGDWFHTDTPENVTRRGKNPLDVDGRWAKVARVGIQIMRRMIDAALEKHETVTVINAIGNHDEQTSQMLNLCLEVAYEKNPRVKIDVSPDGFHWYEFGNNLIGVHHGHKVKPEALYKVMAEDKREQSGRCEHRYWYTGHIHHQKRQDVGGQVIESFRTLIPRDTYSHSHGYRSKRDICAVTLHRQHGETLRNSLHIGAIIEQIDKDLTND